MIRKTWDEENWLLISQAEHARLSGLIAAAWNFAGPKPHPEVIAAIHHHDDGWNEADAEPQPNSEGDPRAFDEIDWREEFPIWERSIHLLFEAEKYYAAGLVAGHFAALARQINLSSLSPKAAVEIGNFIGRQQALLSQCATNSNQKSNNAQVSDSAETQTAPNPKNFPSDLRLLQVSDWLSLLICTDFDSETQICDAPYLAEIDIINIARPADKLVLSASPLPFRKSMRAQIEATVVPKKPYENSDELKAAIKSGRNLSVEVHIGDMPVEKNDTPDQS